MNGTGHEREDGEEGHRSVWTAIGCALLLGSCEPSLVQQNACVSDADCGGGLLCVDSLCIDPVTSSRACNSDADCPGQVCSSVGLCTEGTPQQDCLTTGECPDHQYCRMALEQPICVNLEPGACRAAEHCPGRICSAPLGGVGRCVECLGNTDCASGRCWPDGTCETACVPGCDTGRGEMCVEGTCLQDPDWVAPVSCPDHASPDASNVCVCDPGYLLDGPSGRCEQDPTTDPCQGETETGRCDGNTRVWCEDDTAEQEECGGLTCQWAGDGYRCLVLTDPCRGETEPGRCDRNTLWYCVDDTVYVLDCAEQGLVCEESYQGATCEEGGGSDDCGAETADGRCDGDVVIWCYDEQVQERDCSETGRICGISHDNFHTCIDDDDPCQGESYDGRCDGDTLIWCSRRSDQVFQQDCAEQGWTCGPDLEGEYKCIDCLGETYVGRCDEDNVLHWCDDDGVWYQECDEDNLTCGWAGEDIGYLCQ